MLGQAAPFLGQGGIDPRMVSGPSSDFMTQMSSLPIRSRQPWNTGQGGGQFYGGQFSPYDNVTDQPWPGGGATFGVGMGMQPGGPPMPGKGLPGVPGGIDPNYGMTYNNPPMPGQPRDAGFIANAKGFPGVPGASSPDGRYTGYMPNPNPMTPGANGMPTSGPGSMASYLPGGGSGMEQPFTRTANPFGGPGFEGPNSGMPGGRPDPNDPRIQEFIRKMTGNPVANGPGGRQTQPFQPQGPGQRVTQEQLAARGLNPQEVQRRLQQFAGGQLGWQQHQQGGGVQGGGQMPGQPDMNDSRVQDLIRSMTGNPVASGPGGGMPPGIRRMVPRQNPRQGMPRPPGPGTDMIARPIPPDGPDYGSDMISRPIPPQQTPTRPGTGRPTAGKMLTSGRQQQW